MYGEGSTYSADFVAGQTCQYIKTKALDIKKHKHFTQVYRGYVDDPRNTDQSWMETTAVNFHDETGELVGQLQLHAGEQPSFDFCLIFGTMKFN